MHAQPSKIADAFAIAQYRLGIEAAEQGRHEAAAGHFREAIQRNPDVAGFHNSLGMALRAQGKLGEAIASYRRAMELEPGLAQIHNNLGNAWRELGELDHAIDCYRRAAQLMPDLPMAHNHLGVALKDAGRLSEAQDAIRRAVAIAPGYADAWSNLGDACAAAGELDEAIGCYRRAVELEPDHAQACNNLGNALHLQARNVDAIAMYRRALEIRADNANAWANLACALDEVGRLDEAADCCRRALELNPDLAEAHANLASILKDAGQADEAIARQRHVLLLRPGDAQAHSNLVYYLHFSPGSDAKTLWEEARDWHQKHARALAGSLGPHTADRRPDRRLRVGYVSPDLKRHPVARFLLPLLEAHDRSAFEVFCYASVFAADDMTDRCRAAADQWRDVAWLSDEDLARLVRQDQVDVLVDLAMHTGRNRLLAFARQPAPVQIAWLAYCGTTGLDAIAFRLTDPYLDPPGEENRYYSEQSVWLPETYWCYRPSPEAPEVGPLPALENGRIALGSLNNFAKVSPPALEAWARLMQAVPDSTLLLHAPEGGHRRRVQDFLVQRGIAADRLSFVGYLPAADYFRTYHRLDLALDPFPYGGGTTTCDALWMGVPVVSLAGRTGVGRGGASLLANAGLPELVARDESRYVDIGAGLGGDRSRLAELRATLRRRLRGSPLMDEPRFARNIETAYRRLWQRWCARP